MLCTSASILTVSWAMSTTIQLRSLLRVSIHPQPDSAMSPSMSSKIRSHCSLIAYASAFGRAIIAIQIPGNNGVSLMCSMQFLDPCLGVNRALKGNVRADSSKPAFVATPNMPE